MQEADFRCNRIRNAALRLRYKTTGHGFCFAIFGRFAGKNLKNPSSSRPAVTQFVTKSVTDDLLRQTESGSVFMRYLYNPPRSRSYSSSCIFHFAEYQPEIFLSSLDLSGAILSAQKLQAQPAKLWCEDVIGFNGVGESSPSCR